MSPIIVSEADECGADVLTHVEAIRLILEADVFEDQMGAMLRDYCREHLTDIELMSEVHDRLAKCKIISKANFRKVWEA